MAVEAWMTAKTPKVKAQAAAARTAPEALAFAAAGEARTAPAVQPGRIGWIGVAAVKTPTAKAAAAPQPQALDLSALAAEANAEIDAIFSVSKAKAASTPKKTPANTPAKAKAATKSANKAVAAPAAVAPTKAEAGAAGEVEWDETEAAAFEAGEWAAAGEWREDEEAGAWATEDHEAEAASTALFASPLGSRMPQFAGVKVYLASPLGSPKPVSKWTYADFEGPSSTAAADVAAATKDGDAAKAAAKEARKAEKRALKKAAKAMAADAEAPVVTPKASTDKLMASPARTAFGNVTNV
jgi:hypothetical protein